MLKYEDVVNAPLSKLKAAADDWAEMVTKLDQLADDAGDGMKAKADKADWEGLNAGVTKGFITKTAKEFKDAAAEAKGLKLLLAEAHAAFKKAQDALIEIRDHDAPAADFHVSAAGKVTARHPAEDFSYEQRYYDPEYPEYVQKQKAAIKAWQAKIDLIVDNCNDTDVSFRNSLEANVTDRKDFSAPKYTKMDQEEAVRANSYVVKGRDITHTELQAFNELMHDNRNSTEFSKAFYEKLTPEKSLTFFGQLTTSTHQTGGLDKQRLKDVQALQKNMGLTLAAASKDKAFTAEWGPELRKLGTERIPLARNDHGGPYGYQLLGGIMRFGSYDAKFLNPIAEHVAQLHQKDPGRFADKSVAGNQLKGSFNPSGVTGAGYDPVVSMLEALGNSPDAAKHFFSDGPTAYNEDGTENKSALPDLGRDGKEEIKNYIDFFGNENWKSALDFESPDKVEESRGYMPDALGRALEAATLGYPAGHPDATVERGTENAAIMQQVMEKYGDAGLLKKQEAMADSLGIMGAGYIDDINWAVDKADSESLFTRGADADDRISFEDQAKGRKSARQFLSALGQHPDAYATLSVAEQVYTRSMLEGQVGPGGINEGGARSALQVGAQVQGMLDESRAGQAEATSLKAHEDYEKAVAKRTGWIEFGATTGVAAGVAFLPPVAAVGTAAVLIPLATDTGIGIVEQSIGQVIGDISGSSTDKHKEMTEEEIRENKTAIYSAGELMAEAPMEEFRARNGIAKTSDFGVDLQQAMWAGYAAGNDRARQQGNDPETGD